MKDQSLERLASLLQPEQCADVPSLRLLLDRFCTYCVRQPSHEPVAINVRTRGRDISIEGFVCYPAMRTALHSILKRTSLQLKRSSIRLLPNAKNKKDSLFLAASRDFLGLSSPDHSSSVVHVWTKGDPVLPLFKQGDFTLCASITGYTGWIPGFVKGDVWKEDIPAKTVIRFNSADWLGIPYVWGACSLKGTDCSGLIQQIYSRNSLWLPRDAHQQLLTGRIVATHTERHPLKLGDLLFFTHADGRIGHVAISLGGWRYLHAQEPSVTINSLLREDHDYDPYRAGNFVVAKRIIG